MSALSPGVTTRTIAIASRSRFDRTSPTRHGQHARAHRNTFGGGAGTLPTAELQQLHRDLWPGALHEVADSWGLALQALSLDVRSLLGRDRSHIGTRLTMH